MDLGADNDFGLTNEQTDKILQFQDLTGIEDMTICREVLQRHQWDLEVAVQEQLNMREGRPSVFATEARPPAVVRDADARVFTPPRPAGGLYWLLGYIYNLGVSLAYNTVSSILDLLFSLIRGDDRRSVTDPLGDVMSFINSYTAKYSPHPVFYQGTYSQALNDAKQELRFLIVYLHSENSSETHNFCRTTLSDPEVVSYLNSAGLVWGCGAWSGEGRRAAAALGGAGHGPLLAVVCVRAHRMALVARSEGACSPAQLLARLRQVLADNEPHLAAARAERVERAATASLRASQDVAYEESLRADQLKEQRRLERLEQERLEREREIEQINSIQRRQQEVVEAKVQMGTRLPAEPSAGEPGTIAVLIKLPCGTRLERRFRLSSSIEDLYDYVYSHPSSPEEFEIVTNFPKRVLARNPGPSLAALGLQNRDVLFVCDSNA